MLHYTSTTLIAEFLSDSSKFVLDHSQNFLCTCEQSFETFNKCLHFFKLVFDLLAFEASELLKAHLEDGGRLLVAEFEFFSEFRMRFLNSFRSTDKLDDAVDMVERLLETKENMLSIFRVS